MKENAAYEEENFIEDDKNDEQDKEIYLEENYDYNSKTSALEGIQKLFIMQLIACSLILAVIFTLKSFNLDLFNKFKTWYTDQLNYSIMADDTDDLYTKAIKNISNIVKIKINGESKVQAANLKGTLGKPLKDAKITNEFSATHKGVDLAAPKGTDIISVADGTVEQAGVSSSYGNYIKIDHGNNLKTLYAHCDTLCVKENENITKGQKIATVGSTGDSTGDHLHFELILNDEYLNPIPLIDGDYS